MTPLEILAIVFTLANVWLAIKENLWTWPTGIVSVILYGVVFYQSRLYANAGLQVVYFFMSIHGWYEWLHGGVNKTELRVRRTTKRQWIGCAVAGVALTALLMWTLRRVNGSAPFSDALTTAFSIVGQWMLNEKLLENWLIWLAVDIVYVPLFVLSDRKASAFLYAFFCLLCVKGFIDWKRSLRVASA
ncbi:MAG TPA: nicotinamide riboside transporter PnuC [Thermoanaerobaculia bacterium]